VEKKVIIQVVDKTILPFFQMKGYMFAVELIKKENHVKICCGLLISKMDIGLPLN
jgi:hypothetical protein